MATRPAPRAGTGYIGLDQWLSLNRPQAAAMADSLVGDVNAQGQKAEDLLSEAGEYFQHGIDGSSINYDDGVKDGKKEGDIPFAGNNGLLRAEQADRDAQAFIKEGWKGPTSLEGIKPYEMGRTAASDTARNANLAADQYGRTALLQDKYGKTGGYTYGQQRLDSALAGAAGGDKIDAAKKQWGGLLGKFDKANTDAATRAKAAEQRNKDVAKQYADTATAKRAQYEKDMAAWNKEQNKVDRAEEGVLTGPGRLERDADRQDKWRGNRGGSGGKANEGRYTWDFYT